MQLDTRIGLAATFPTCRGESATVEVERVS